MRKKDAPAPEPVKAGRRSANRKTLERLYLLEEERGERRATFFILAILIPSILVITALLALEAKFHLNGVLNLLMAAVVGVYYSIIALLLKAKAYKPFLKYVSVSVNIAVLTAALCGYSIQSGWLHTMRTAVLTAYLFAIAASGLYQSPAVPLFAGGLSSVAYCAIASYGIFVIKTPISPVETFQRPAYSFDVLVWVLAVFIFMALIVSSLNRRYRLMLERSLSSEAYSKVVKRAHSQKTRFFINLAHETKTPLTLISNYMGDIAEKYEDEPGISLVLEYVDKLKRDMLNFLDLEKLKKGTVFFDHARVVDAARALSVHCFLFNDYASKKGLGFSTSIPAKVYVRIDPAALDRVYGNLIDNAVKYTERGGSVRVSLAESSGHAVFTVEDTGPGIPEKMHKDVFKPFHQLSHEKRNTQGIGMGLSIVKRIVEDAGGSIRLENPSSGGTRFTVTLPSAPRDADGGVIDAIATPGYLPAMTDVALLPQGTSPGKPVVLVVEDNKALLRYLQDKLRRDYNVRYALNGADALEVLKEHPLPDVIVSDVMMDTMDGYEFLDRLSESEEYAAIPFIFVTALASFKHKLKALRKGAIEYLYKPFHIDELSGKIRSILKVRDALSARNMRDLGKKLSAAAAARGRSDAEGMTPVNPASPNAPGPASDRIAERYGVSTRQVQIAALLRVGLERKEIGDRLGISLNTVNTQIRRMFDKCGVNNRVELLNILSEEETG